MMVFGISEIRNLRKTECRDNQTLEIRNRILKRSTNRGAKLLGPNGGNVGPDFATRNQTVFSGSWRPWDLKMKLRVERGSGGFAIILHSRSVRSGYLRKFAGRKEIQAPAGKTLFDHAYTSCTEEGGPSSQWAHPARMMFLVLQRLDLSRIKGRLDTCH